MLVDGSRNKQMKSDNDTTAQRWMKLQWIEEQKGYQWQGKRKTIRKPCRHELSSRAMRRSRKLSSARGVAVHGSSQSNGLVHGDRRDSMAIKCSSQAIVPTA
nr:hypothetical protein CFP56_10034 [Quercus suber]